MYFGRIKYCYFITQISILFIILAMANRAGGASDWDKKRQQAQPFINRIRSVWEKKTRSIEQIGFLRRCQKEKLTQHKQFTIWKQTTRTE